MEAASCGGWQWQWSGPGPPGPMVSPRLGPPSGRVEPGYGGRVVASRGHEGWGYMVMGMGVGRQAAADFWIYQSFLRYL